MNFIGVDLHRRIITVCVMNEQLTVLSRKTLYSDSPDDIADYFRQFQPFQVVVEATASYHWFVELVEPLAEKIVLANPNKLRVIAESTKKTDRLDAQALAEFLARDMIPQSYMPTPRQRQHRALIRHRQYIRSRMTAVRNKIRRILSDYNADRQRPVFVQCRAGVHQAGCAQRRRPLRRRPAMGRLPALRRAAHEIWTSAQGVRQEGKSQREGSSDGAQDRPWRGSGDDRGGAQRTGGHRRFRNAKAVCAYAGLAPVVRQSGGKKSKDLGISKQGSGLLRWALVEASWRTVNTSPKWKRIYERIAKRAGGKRAIVAVARKLLCVLYAMLKTMTPYRILTT